MMTKIYYGRKKKWIKMKILETDEEIDLYTDDDKEIENSSFKVNKKRLLAKIK